MDQGDGAGGKLFGAAPRFRPGIVKRVVCGLRRVLFAMPDVCVHLAANVLDEAPAEINVQKLHSVTNGQDRLLFRKSIVQQRPVGALAAGVCLGAPRMPRRALARGVNVSRTPGQDERLEGLWKRLY